MFALLTIAEMLHDQEAANPRHLHHHPDFVAAA
jgi:hypothetical protein